MKKNFILILLLYSTSIFSQNKLWPTKLGKSYSSNFGEFRSDHFHMGLDIKTNGKIGMEVLAIEDGYISRNLMSFCASKSPWRGGSRRAVPEAGTVL